MNQLFKPLLLFVLALSFYSCDKEDEQVPAYLHITKFSFTSKVADFGLGTSDIIGAKVFVNGQEIGNFELPVTIPVLSSGNAIVEIFPNVKENASGSNQKYYKPYMSYIDTLFLEPKIIDTIAPKSTYRSNTNLVWMEDFEDQAISMVKSGYNNTNDSIVAIPTNTFGVDQPFSGSDYTGYVNIVSDSLVIFERSTVNSFLLPNLGTDVYVEMDIKTNVPVQVGIYADNNITVIQSPVLVVTATNGNWKKIYVNLKSETGDLTAGTKVRIFLGTYKETGDTVDKHIYVDNLKLLYVQ
jgi:hypothetical protein